MSDDRENMSRSEAAKDVEERLRYGERDIDAREYGSSWYSAANRLDEEK